MERENVLAFRIHRPLPHSITINMHATRCFRDSPTCPGKIHRPNGTIGRYSISISINGTTWGAPVVTGTWADDKSRKTAVFSTVSARYVRLTALTEAGSRGPDSSAAEIGLSGAAADRPGVITYRLDGFG